MLDHCAEIHNLEWKDVHEIDEALFFLNLHCSQAQN